MQNTLLAIALALIVAILAALAGPWLIDWNAHRPRIEAEAARLLGQPVTIGGDVSIRLLPTIQIDARDVRIGAPGGDGAVIGRLRGALRVAPLLRGQMALTSIHIRDADVTLGAPGAGSQLVAADEVLVENARLSVRDADGKPRLLAERLMLSGESRGVRGPLRLEGSAVVGETMVPVNLAAALTDANALALRVRAGDRAQAGTLELDGLVAAGSGLRLDGEIVVAGQVGALAWRVAGPVALTPAALVIERTEAQLGSDDKAARATGSVRLAFGADAALEAVLTARQVDIDRLFQPEGQAFSTPLAGLNAIVAAIPVLARPALPVTIGLDLGGVTLAGGLVGDFRGDLRASEGGWRLEQLSARLPGQATVEASGTLVFAPNAAFSGPVSLQAARPAQLLSWVDGLATPEGTLEEALRLRAAVTAAPGRIALDGLSLATAAGTAEGRLALDRPASGRHGLTVELTASALDLDLLIRLARGAGARLDPATDSRVLLKAGQVRLAGLAARDFDLAVTTDGRSFEAERLRIGDFAGFGMDLSGRLDGLDGPLVGRLSGRARAESLDGLVALLSRYPQTSEIARQLALRAAVMNGADLEVTFAAGGQSALGLRVEGRLGETVVNLDAAGAGNPLQPAGLTGRATLGLEAPGADQVVTLVTGAPPAGATPATPTRVTMSVDRWDRDRFSLQGEVTAAGTRVRLNAGQTGENTSLSGSLASPDTSPLVPLIGLPAELAGRLPARLDLTASARGADWRLERLAGTIGGTTIAAEGTGRGMTVAGQVQLGRLPIEVLAALLTGPGWLVESTGLAPEAPFGTWMPHRLGGTLTVSADAIVLPSGPPLTGFSARLRRTGSRTEVTDGAASLGEAALAVQLSLDGGPLGTLLAGRLSARAVPAALAWPGAAGTAAISLDLTGEGASPAGLIASLRGDGTLAFGPLTVTGIDPRALRRATRQAEVAQDLDRPLTDMAFGAALEQALAAPVAVPPGSVPLRLAGAMLRAGEATYRVAGGGVAWTGSADLAEGRLSALVRIAPDLAGESEAVPTITARLQGPFGATSRELDTDDVSGWLGLRLVDRAAERLGMSESDRLERQRQRAFSRFTSRPPPDIVLPLPPMPPPPTAEMFAPPPAGPPLSILPPEPPR